MIDALVSATALVVARALTFAGLMVVVGATSFAFRIAPAFGDESLASAQRVGLATRRVVQLAVLALALLLGVRLIQQSAAFADTPSAWTTTVSLVLARTTWGTGWLVQGGALIIVALSWRWAERVRLAPRAALGVALVALVTSPALAGHAIGAPRLAPLAIVADAVHVAAAGAWIGTLFVIAVVALPALRLAPTGTLPAILARFSPLALVSAALLITTGLFASWLHLETVPALWNSTYGRTLLLKLAAFGAVAALGAFNWRVATPRMLATGDGTAMRRSIALELAFAALLVLVTAVLVATPLPSEM